MHVKKTEKWQNVIFCLVFLLKKKLNKKLKWQNDLKLNLSLYWKQEKGETGNNVMQRTVIATVVIFYLMV